jgi:hypothetical protein
MATPKKKKAKRKLPAALRDNMERMKEGKPLLKKRRKPARRKRA